MLKKLAWLMFVVVLVLGFGGYAEAANVTTYTVEKNDSLRQIALRFFGNAATYRTIAADNNISNPNLIHPGRVLTINREATAKVQTATPRQAVAVLAPVDTIQVETVTVIDTIVGSSEPQLIVEDDTPRLVDEDNEPRLVADLPVQSGFNASRRTRYIRRPGSINPRVAQIEELIAQVFGPVHTPMALAISRAENGSRGCHVQGPRNNNGTYDTGVFQINDIHRRRFAGYNFADCVDNIQIAYQLFRKEGWRPWVAYTNGNYAKYIDQYRRLYSQNNSPRLVDRVDLVSLNQQ